MPTRCLVLYYSRHGSVARMARLIARGIESVDNANAVVRCVPALTSQSTDAARDEDAGSDPVVSESDLSDCDALALGSPTRFGNMAAPVKAYIDSTSGLWLSGALAGKPASVFTSTGTLHGGQETTLITMMLPLLHHGMLISGLPYSETELSTTQSGGTPYGASHLASPQGDRPVDEDERALCMAQGRRLANIAVALKAARDTL